MMQRIIWSLIGVFAISALGLLLVGQRISLVAQDQVMLHDKPMGGVVIKKLEPGEVAAIVRCEDLKHYIVPVVSLDGKDGYAVDGKYRLNSKRTWELSGVPLSFSCP